jgi:hypothetical protein
MASAATRVLTSCSHRGVTNTVRAATSVSGIDEVLAVIGGFHIVPPLDDDYIRRAIAEFRAIDPKYIIVGHCTGYRFYDLAHAELGDKVIHSAVARDLCSWAVDRLAAVRLRAEMKRGLRSATPSNNWRARQDLNPRPPGS